MTVEVGLLRDDEPCFFISAFENAMHNLTLADHLPSVTLLLCQRGSIKVLSVILKDCKLF